MTSDELRQLIADVQRRQSELDNIEVKAGTWRHAEAIV
jgi:hypothetical protein